MESLVDVFEKVVEETTMGISTMKTCNVSDDNFQLSSVNEVLTFKPLCENFIRNKRYDTALVTIYEFYRQRNNYFWGKLPLSDNDIKLISIANKLCTKYKLIMESPKIEIKGSSASAYYLMKVHHDETSEEKPQLIFGLVESDTTIRLLVPGIKRSNGKMVIEPIVAI